MDSSWQVIGASVQGTSHQRGEIPCQDAYGCRVLPEGVVLVAVADGAGTAERSEEGARCAVEKMIAAVETALGEGLPNDDAAWDALLVDGFQQARQAIVEIAEAEQVPPRAFATTLTCAVVCDEWLAAGQIGDGVVIAQGKDGRLFTVCEPQHGEYAGETFFLTMEEALQQVKVSVFAQSVAALAMMTDGLVRLAMDLADIEPYSPFFQPLIAFTLQVDDEAEAQEQLAAFLASKRVTERTDDDKTLVLIARLQAPEPGVASGEDDDVDGCL